MVQWTLLLALALVTTALLMVTRRVHKLRQELRALAHECAELRVLHLDIRQDVGGLSSAGANQDRVLMDHDLRLRELQERIESLYSEQSAQQPYHAAIERIRRGAQAEELVAEFGLSLSEASLLARLHGGNRGGR